MVLNFDGDTEGDGDHPAPALFPEAESSLPAKSENPIGALQEYCQTKALPMPTYDFEDAFGHQV
jgi:hypothetical protein